jgi:BRCT domain type II-containing protein
MLRRCCEEGKPPMRIPKAAIGAAVSIVFLPAMILRSAQVPATSVNTSATGTPASYFTPSAPSDILQRALDEVRITVAQVRLDKWKRGSIRDEAGTNVDAIQRDMQGALPALLKDADAAPGTLSKVLPLSRNVDALYDVLVHLVEQARVSGPGDQAGQLQVAIADLEKARVILDNQIQQTADAQERQVVELRTTVQKQEESLRVASTPPPAPKCPAPAAPAKKKHHTTKSTTKPASGSSTSTTTSKPQ